MTTVASLNSPPRVLARQLCDPGALRAWLAERWAILFSHPDDFAQEQMEMDRWISVVSSSFSGHGVAPVALASGDRRPDQGWLERLAAPDNGCAAVLSLGSPPPGILADLSAGALRAQIARCGPRFAMIVDSNLRCRRALSYRLPSELPSPLILIGWAVALRRRDRAPRLVSVTRESSPRAPSPWERGLRCSVSRHL